MLTSSSCLDTAPLASMEVIVTTTTAILKNDIFIVTVCDALDGDWFLVFDQWCDGRRTKLEIIVNTSLVLLLHHMMYIHITSYFFYTVIRFLWPAREKVILSQREENLITNVGICLIRYNNITPTLFFFCLVGIAVLLHHVHTHVILFWLHIL